MAHMTAFAHAPTSHSTLVKFVIAHMLTNYGTQTYDYKCPSCVKHSHASCVKHSHAHQRVTAHTWKRHGTYINASRCKYKCVMAHTLAFASEPVVLRHSRVHQRVTAHMWTCHVTHIDVSSHTHR